METLIAESPIVERLRRLQGHLSFAISPLHTVEAEPITRRRDVKVWRVKLTDPAGVSSSVFAKELCVDDPTDFHSECANYLFLQKYRDRFDRFAELLAMESDVFVIADLGSAFYQFESNERVLEAIADTFARMHVYLAPFEREYDEIRAAQGLPSQREENRRNSEAGRRETAQRGVTMLADYVSLMGIAPTEPFTRQAEECFDIIFDPASPFRTFIHDDVADRRQTIVRDGRVYLLDFEHAKFHHALMDLAKLMIGKVEHHSELQGMFYNHPNIPSELIGKYRERWASLGARELSTDEWDRNVVAAFVTQVMLVIGRIVEIGGFRFAATHSSIIRDLLARLRLQTSPYESSGEIRATLQMLEGRILG